MKKLFISYAREDRSRVEPFVECLRSAGFEVFWDLSMPAGVDWAEFLEAQLGSAHRLVVLWTAASVASRWVRTEADEALLQGKLLPVLLDDVRPPLAFRQIHCFDLIGWHGAHDDSRLARLAGELNGPGGGAGDTAGLPPRRPAEADPPGPTPAWRWPLLIGAAAVALVWLVFNGWQRSGEPIEGPSPEASAASAPDSLASKPVPVPPPAVPSAPAPSPADRRCADIKEQVALGNPVSPSDHAFLKAGCR
jgi:TIR domain